MIGTIPTDDRIDKGPRLACCFNSNKLSQPQENLSEKLAAAALYLTQLNSTPLHSTPPHHPTSHMLHRCTVLYSIHARAAETYIYTCMHATDTCIQRHAYKYIHTGTSSTSYTYHLCTSSAPPRLMRRERGRRRDRRDDHLRACSLLARCPRLSPRICMPAPSLQQPEVQYT
jgi:hypothetical protein